MTAATPTERIRARLVPDGDCLVYNGSRDEKGYGRVNVDGKNRKAHRVLYEAIRGPIPAGMVVMHLCDNPPCCRIEHLHLGTVADNNRDAMAKDRARWVGWLNSKKTECKWGHPLLGDNLKVRRNGRGCRTCARNEAKVYNSQRRKVTS